MTEGLSDGGIEWSKEKVALLGAVERSELLLGVAVSSESVYSTRRDPGAALRPWETPNSGRPTSQFLRHAWADDLFLGLNPKS